MKISLIKFPNFPKNKIISSFLLFLFLPVFLQLTVQAGSGPVEKYSGVQYVMGTLFRIELYADSAPKAQKAFDLAFKELRKYELIMSNYRPDSELARVLKTASKKPTLLSPELYDIFRQSLEYSEITNGSFDITVGPLVRLWGFKNKNFKKPSSEEIGEARKNIGFRYIYLNPYNHTVFLKKAGMEIDFGGIGKGYAIDRAVKLLQSAGIKSALIDSVSNQYYLGSLPSGAAWKAGIKHPRRPDTVIKILSLLNKAVSTSGDYEQFFIEGGIRYSHIIDPKTGYPVKTDIAAVTVVSKDSVVADVLSTSAFLLSEQQLKNVLKRLGNIHLTKIIKGKQIGQIEYRD